MHMDRDMRDSRDRGRPDGQANVRLSTARDSRETVDLILAVRGRVVNVSGRQHQRWRIRTQRGHVLTFRPEFVVAITTAKRRVPERAPASSPVVTDDAAAAVPTPGADGSAHSA